MSDYKFIVVPCDGFANETIANYLSQNASIAGSEIIFSLDGDKEKRGYVVTHQVVTTLKKNSSPRLKFEFYEQKGDGAIRKYSIPSKKDSKKLREVKKQLAGIKKGDK